MTDFDPDAYLASKAVPAPTAPAPVPSVDATQVQQFDPDQYLDQKGSAQSDATNLDLQNKYGTPLEIAKTALEQGASGATLGASKVLETKLGITTPEAMAGREAANPGTSFLSNVGGTAALLGITGGASALTEGAGIATKIGAGALEGASIGGINSANDDWSQNKALDAQKIAANAGLGALLGAAGTGLVEGIKSKFSPLVKKGSGSSELQPGGGIDSPMINEPAPLIDAPGPPVPSRKTTGKLQFKGVQPTTYQDVIDNVNKAKMSGSAVELPQKAELLDAVSRIEMENPVNPVQVESLGSQDARNIYQTAKEMPGEVGQAFVGNEALQKSELVGKVDQGIKDLSPGSVPTPDAIDSGKSAINAFTYQYQAENNELGGLFKGLKDIPLQGDILTDSVGNMMRAVPKIANMFEPLESTGGDLQIKPYRTLMGIDEATYKAVKQAVSSLQEAPNDFESLWNIRKGLDQNVDVLTKGQAPTEIRSLKAALMSQMEDAAPDAGVRDIFKRKAINEQQREVIEKVFGASVGSPEFGSISKVKPEKILDHIFSDTATVNAAKTILPPEKFDAMLANYLSKARAAATDKGAFSSNNFGRFLRTKQSVLSESFAGKPQQLQRLKDITTIMRILPDSPSINPSGTAKTLARMVSGLNVHDMTWEGMLLTLPKKALSGIANKIQLNDLDKALQGQAVQNNALEALKGHVFNTSTELDKGIKSVFSGTENKAKK